MPASLIHGPTSWRHWVPVCCGLMTVTLLGVLPAQAAPQRTTLGRVQRLLPATTVALAVVPVHDGLRDGLAQVLNPEQKTEALLVRLSSLSKERIGLDLWSTETLVGFLCEGGEQGVLMLGSYGAGGLKQPDRHIGGLGAISMGEGTYLARVGGALALAPRATLELLSRVEQGKNYKLLGTPRLKAFRAGRGQLSGDGANLYLEGKWLMDAISTKDQAPRVNELKVVVVSFLPGRVKLQAVGSKEALSQIQGLVKETVDVLKLQHTMLSETQERQVELRDRLGRVFLTEIMGGLIDSITVESSPDRLFVRFSLPTGLNLVTMSLVAAMFGDSGSTFLEAFKPPWAR
jgi:hypothetical protein